MGNFLSQLQALINKDSNSAVPGVQLDFEGKYLTSGSAREMDVEKEYCTLAIGDPSPETEAKAWDHVRPAAAKLKMFYQHSTSIENCLPQILQALCIGDVNKNLETNPALARILCRLLDFVFEFDSMKMKTPQIQNDFSYYRRCLSRGKLANEGDLKSAMVEDELANQVSMFFAYPTPMLKTVTEVTTNFVNQRHVGRSVSECMAALAATCYHAVSNNKKKQPSQQLRPETTAFCLRVMVIAIIIYDHIDPRGAFTKSSPINIKSSVKVIHAHGNSNDTPNLISALRYNTKHLNDASTPKTIKTLMASCA
ncbi:Protein fam49a [Mortierella sp. GBA43]|nr:Protein fam49a [Mortierella sp. GBA43]